MSTPQQRSAVRDALVAMYKIDRAVGNEPYVPPGTPSPFSNTAALLRSVSPFGSVTLAQRKQPQARSSVVSSDGSTTLFAPTSSTPASRSSSNTFTNASSPISTALHEIEGLPNIDSSMSAPTSTNSMLSHRGISTTPASPIGRGVTRNSSTISPPISSAGIGGLQTIGSSPSLMPSFRGSSDNSTTVAAPPIGRGVTRNSSTISPPISSTTAPSQVPSKSEKNVQRIANLREKRFMPEDEQPEESHFNSNTEENIGVPQGPTKLSSLFDSAGYNSNVGEQLLTKKGKTILRADQRQQAAQSQVSSVQVPPAYSSEKIQNNMKAFATSAKRQEDKSRGLLDRVLRIKRGGARKGHRTVTRKHSDNDRRKTHRRK